LEMGRRQACSRLLLECYWEVLGLCGSAAGTITINVPNAGAV
jgi:hypothetical protein